MDDSFTDTVLLRASIGFCIMNWAHVETELNMFFHSVSEGRPEGTDLMWSSMRSFDLKLQVLNSLVTQSDLTDEIKSNWRLLCEYIPSQYRLRNMVAHSTPIDVQRAGKPPKQCVMPFMVLFGLSSRPLDTDEINEFARSFFHLRNAINSINPGIKKSGKRRPKSPELEHDLIRRLRKEDALKREAQRHRSQAWRQYLESHPELKKPKS